MNFNNQKVILVGFGRENQSVYKFLRHSYPQIKLAVADQLDLADWDEKWLQILKNDRVDFYYGQAYLKNLSQFDWAVLTPGVNKRELLIQGAINQGLKITTATDLFLTHTQGHVIGVTGSKGKSTTTSLIHHVLRTAGMPTALVGNIGKPALDQVSDLDSNGYYVYEMSSYMLENLTAKMDIGVWVSFFPDHLTYHQTLENYFSAKAKIADHSDFLVFNYAYENIRAYANQISKKSLPYNDGIKTVIKNDAVYYDNVKIISLDELQLIGRHNLENIMAVLVIAREIFQLDNQIIIKALKSFTPLPHRLNYVGRYDGIIFYDDAISTTPESTIMAIDALKGQVDTIILGGTDRKYDFSLLAKKIVQENIFHIILFPETGQLIKQAIETVVTKQKKIMPEFFATQNMAKAVKWAKENTQNGKICLLSTASPSYSLFKNFEEKGDLFIKYIKE